MKFNKVAARIFALIIPTVALTVTAFAVFSYYESESRINTSIDEKMWATLQAADLEMQLEFYKNAVVAMNFAKYGETMDVRTFDHISHQKFLEENIGSNKNTFGGGVWFEPYVFDSESYYFGPFLYIDEGGEAHYAYEYAEYADYFNEEWYIKGKAANGEIAWSKAYHDPFSGITMLTASKAFFDENGKMIGMGTADMNLEDIRKIWEDISVWRTGKAFIIGAEGECISFPGKNIDDTILSVDDTKTDDDKELARLGAELLKSNEPGTTTYRQGGKTLRVYHMTMASVGWTMGISIEESEINASTISSVAVMIIIPVSGLALVILGVYMIAKYLRRITNKVNNFAALAASGDMTRQIDVTETDEFGFMERQLNIMINNMNDMRIRSEEAFAKTQEADERTKIMLDATPLCCSLFDRELNVIDCNEEAVKLYGMLDKKEYIGKFYEFSPERQPDGSLSSEKARVLLAETFVKGRLVFEWIHRHPNGTEFPAEVTLVRVKRGDETIVAAYTRDLREYKKMMGEIDYKDKLLRTVNKAAATLLQSETDEFYEYMWRSMGMMAESVGADRMYIWKNYEKDGKLHCTQVYEWSEGADPQQGQDITINIPYSETVPGWEEKLSGGACVNGLVRNMSPEEQAQLSPQGILSILVVPVFLRDQFWGFVGFDDCHNERIFTPEEEAILRSGSLLIAHAMLRNQMTLDIQAAVEAAQAASRAKSNFLSNMSHEIRTPLNAIAGMTLIGRSAADAERKDYAFGKIGDASNHLLGVINDILDMSKIEADKFELSAVSYNFEKMLQRLVSVISYRIDEKQQRFAVFLDKDIPRIVIGDDQRLSQVITNLLSNAVKFTPEHGSIRLDTHLISDEGGICTLQVDVTDTGIGISPDRHARLFDSFEQADSAISRQYGGTGLGLTISKNIIELMGGKIWVTSELGKGAKFSFTVHVERGTEETVYPTDPSMNWQTVRVLFVDDDADIREYFTGIAEQLGLTFDVANGSDEALQMIGENGAYNIYFVDWKMPGKNGIELSRDIKARGIGKSIIIMVSAYEWNIIEKDAREAGVNKFLPKPLFPSAITDCINEYLGHSVQVTTKQANMNVSFEGYRILLAEDVEINREIVISLLESTQVEIECAVNGAEALRMYSDAPERYDMILMDMQMPEMDGLEATRRIRSLRAPEAGKVPIIAMTANVFREDIEKCIESGMNDHVGKPLDLEDMIQKMKRFLPPQV